MISTDFLMGKGITFQGFSGMVISCRPHQGIFTIENEDGQWLDVSIMAFERSPEYDALRRKYAPTQEEVVADFAESFPDLFAAK